MTGDTTCYAHSSESSSDVTNWHKLEEHLETVAELAAVFSQPFKSEEWARLAGRWHDLGKYQPEFQRRLRGERIAVEHAGLGAAWAEEKFPGQLGRQVLQYIIAGHHTGLPDFDATGDAEGGVLIQRLKNGLLALQHTRRHLSEHICQGVLPKRPPEGITPADFHVWVRFLFSALTDADYLDTENFFSPDQAKHRGGFVDLKDLKKRFDDFMRLKATRAEATPVNLLRSEILAQCCAAGDHPPGFFSLTVPTGGGKTLSSAAFALEHASKHGLRRIIYVIPFTSIIEQNAEVFRSALGKESVLEHHSNMVLDENENGLLDQARYRLLTATENWDAPFIVTTNVQFFESLFAARSSRCRKLHNIAKSVVILDEAQMVPVELVAPIVAVMKTLQKSFGVTFLFMSATRPNWPDMPPCREIMPDPIALASKLKRVEIELPDKTDERQEWSQLAKELRHHEQVLCIVNSRRDCRDLFAAMPEGTIHLSALMCPAHRSRVVATIRDNLAEGRSLRVISTQLVEAGVDLDFPVVYRALAGLDSIAQAAGRCNREGRRTRPGLVKVFVPPRPAPRGLLLKAEQTTKEMIAMGGFDPLDPSSFRTYFELFFRRANDLGDSYKSLLIPQSSTNLSIQFRTVADRFKIIDEGATANVLVRYQEGEDLINELADRGPSRNLLRKLQRYSVSIPRWLCGRLHTDGVLETVRDEFLAQSRLEAYNDVYGLDIFMEAFAPEDLVL